MPRHLVLRWSRYLLLLLALLLTAPLWAGAAAGSAPAAAQERITGMERPSDLGPVEERRLRFLFWAYNAIWMALAVYLISLWIRLRSVQREMRRLDARLTRIADGTLSE